MTLKGLLKAAVIGFLGLILSVAIVVVINTVSDRAERRESIYQDMIRTSAGAQTVVGPVIVFPYEREGTNHVHIVYPRQLMMKGNLMTERRYRSLYEILLYQTTLTLEGHFEFTRPKDIGTQLALPVNWKKPYLLVLVQDSRGITMVPAVQWAGTSLQTKPGQGSISFGGGVGGFHADLPSEVQLGGKFPFSLDLNLRGTRSIGWIPVGEETQVTFKANWPHPSFEGRGLPETHTINAEGFKADWKSTHFSSDVTQVFRPTIDPLNLQSHAIGFKLFQPVDIYLQTERSVKYGFLFIGLTFAIFLSFETIKKLTIHPVQYAFVGLELVLFYVLLLALSEHIKFVWAYALASTVSVSLLAYYVRFVVNSWKQALTFALSLAALDGIIYGILLSEDFALLYGACLLFGLLAAAMIITRQVNWSDIKLER